MSDTPWEAIGEVVELAVCPSEPTAEGYVIVKIDQILVSYMPSARCDRTSITSCLCSGFHLRIFVFVLTTDSI